MLTKHCLNVNFINHTIQYRNTNFITIGAQTVLGLALLKQSTVNSTTVQQSCVWKTRINSTN